jgi:hypothetical protein
MRWTSQEAELLEKVGKNNEILGGYKSINIQVLDV